ncbi:MAG: hypothetical protein K6E46_02810 [Lachnospiraceae bacterium]|nr:hypothetical protein [Lachnospiraceae bacterium]
MKNNKTLLDERQLQKMYEIEHYGCWLCFWGLLIAIAVQFVIYDNPSKYFAGEWIVFMILCIYLSIACMKNGIWSYRLPASSGVNVIMSLIAGIIFGVITSARLFRVFPNKPVGVIVAGIFAAAFVFVLCFISLQLGLASYKKRIKKLEEEPEDE